MPEGSFKEEVTLREGDRIYISADPGANGGSDIATVKAEIIQEDGENVQSFFLTMLAGGIAVIAFSLALVVIIIFKQRNADLDYAEEDEEEE